MRIDVMTLFPEMCANVTEQSVIGRAIKKGIIELYYHQIRDYSNDKHRRVDDTPYGGGNGMLMRAEPIACCFEDICKKVGSRPHFIYMSPKGELLNQKKIKKIVESNDNIAILCGHYEGVDERVLEEYADEYISIGDYVLTGGELPALVFIDAMARLVPGVLSNSECFEEESHYNGMLEYPQYTKPQIWRGREVPSVLLSGHHANIKKWQEEKALEETIKYRPDLIL